MINTKARPYNAPLDITTPDKFGEAMAQVPKLAYDDYMAGLVKITNTGTKHHKTRIKTGHDVLRLIGCTTWLPAQERAAMQVYKNTFDLLDATA